MSYLAARYATALFEAGCDEDAFAQALEYVHAYEPLRELLLSPVMQYAEKEAVLMALAPFCAHPTLLRFYLLLLRNRRMTLLDDIAAEFHTLYLGIKHECECLVTCVHIPSAAQQAKLSESLCRLHHKEKICLIFKQDPALIGGFILSIDDVTYDQSIRGKLRGLSHHLEEVSSL